jgi:hypothetical protein
MVTCIYLLNQKMVDIEAEGVCVEEATIITVVVRCHILVLLNALLKLMLWPLRCMVLNCRLAKQV